MKYVFDGIVSFYKAHKVIEIPFNIWEVQENIGEYPVEVTSGVHVFSCNLLPKKDGYYFIPIELNNDDFSEDSHHHISMKFTDESPNPYKNSPYNLEHPIRKIDDVKIVTQPWDGLCGQTCIAMLAGISLEEANNIMHCREWQANMGKMVHTLDYLGIPHSDELIYTNGNLAELPKCAIIMEKMGRFSHYLVYFNGEFLDPNVGIMEDFDLANMKGYLEIL